MDCDIYKYILWLPIFFQNSEGFGIQKVSNDPNDVKFLFFPFPNNLNNSEEILYKNVMSLDHSHFQIGLLTVFIIHGFADSAYGTISLIKDAYLKNIPHCNVIMVDWSALSTPVLQDLIDLALGYYQAANNVQIVGKRVSNFILWLVDLHRIDVAHIHLIGHSLGAHVSGVCGYLTKYNFGKKIARITGNTYRSFYKLTSSPPDEETNVVLKA